MQHRLLFFGFWACMTAAGRPAVAHACTCVIGPLVHSEPANGAENVERNRAIILLGEFIPGSISLETADGEPVEFTSYEGPTPTCPLTWGDVVPKQPLAAGTRYRLSVAPKHSMRSDAGKNTITFTTGTGLLADEPLVRPAAKASLWVDVHGSDGCASPADPHACMVIDDPRDVEIVALAGDEVVVRWLVTERDRFSYAEGFPVRNAAPDCIELRRRSATGKRSAPRRICDGSLSVNAGSGHGWRGCDGLDAKLWGALDDGGVELRSEAAKQVPSGDDEDEPPARRDARAPSESPAPEQRSWGCSAMQSPVVPESPVLALVALTLAARSGRRRR